MSGGIEGGRSIFREEAKELLDELESALLGLEENPGDRELVDRVFRAMHTLKGSGAMFGYDNIASFTHEIETYFDLVRSGKLPVTRTLVDLTLSSLDRIASMLEEGVQAEPAQNDEIASAFRHLLSDAGYTGSAPGAASPVFEDPAGEALSGDAATYRIRFSPSKDVLKNGTNPLNLLEELRSLGEMSAVAHTDRVPSMDKAEPDTCYTYWDVVLKTSQGIDAIRDVFIFVEDDSDIEITRLDEYHGDEADGDGNEDGDGDRVLLGDLLVEKGVVSPDAVERALKCQKRIGEMLVEMGEVTPHDIAEALNEQKALNVRKAEAASDSVRVSSLKLDVLAELVGEMVTAQSRLKRVSALYPDSELMNIAEDMEKLAERLRDNTLEMRLVPIGAAFTRFKRLVRDLSGELGKDVRFTTEGGETELDKTVMEKLSDPVMHLIRNCIDHGIEQADERMAAGKQGPGSVRLSASQSGGWISVRIEDDGRGLDHEAIREVAVERGLIAPEDALDTGALHKLIIAPGFSTSRNVSSVSGRGVGMDVVKRCIDSLRGSLEIESVKGSGTAVTLRLPLTLAIIDGLLVTVDGAYYVAPLASVSECVEMDAAASRRAANRGYADFRGQLVPYIHLRGMFRVSGDAPAIQHMVIVEEGGCKVGLAVDQVVGEHQTVIKPMNRVFGGADFLSGATILGDGMPALILDMPGLVRAAKAAELPLDKAA